MTDTVKPLTTYHDEILNDFITPKARKLNEIKNILYSTEMY